MSFGEVGFLRGYQQDGTRFLLENDETLLMWEMSTGKTRTVLNALVRERIFGNLPALVVGPKRVIATQRVWERECHEQGIPLTIQMVHGSAPRRAQQMLSEADVYTTTFDLLKAADMQPLIRRCKILVLDELTFLKSFSGRFKALKPHLPSFVKRWGLTGTPAPNGLLDLFYQIQCLDMGARMGKSKDQFKKRYFYPADYMGYDWKPRNEQEVFNLLDGLVHRVGNEGLPEILPQPVYCPLLPQDMKLYKELAKEQLLALADGTVSAANRAALQNKLRQLATGFVYNMDGEAKWLGVDRMNALHELIDELQGQTVLIVYEYTAQKERILAEVDGAETLDADGAVDRWNAGEIPALVIHAQSGGHGLNLQFGGRHVIWMSMTWALDLWLQVNRRLARPGGADSVFAHVLIAPGTVEEYVYNSVAEGKAQQEARLLGHFSDVG